ncbi:hypothetical protein BO94DRAFT_547955 [Aspergillus sclerotioniger CBS 115572]|uniref:Apple domain-containing protein n=1 Tax=Aspergillus sclerotioniger CBS 115572 TaxID=1450535 RepID=A0A317W6G7_9EURO|nr:hypothetical protein BO94DRAFT_547955 [Aspergillus sclerotioniger CBS 115572]PWY81689.1 hypothetical protein BO94DRAFT_547955 [Aspergillus sclerotioniger CBS 115572]
MKTFSTLFVTLSLLASPISAKGTNCWSGYASDTIGVFSGAPITFSMKLNGPVACGQKCDSVDKCAAWLYTESSGKCELYRRNALHISSNLGFAYGTCDGSSALLNNTTSSSAARVSSISVQASVTTVSNAA